MKPLFTHFVYALGLILCMCQAGGAALPLVLGNPRIAVDLTGEWLFRVNPKDQAQTSKFIADDPDLKDWASVMVPESSPPAVAVKIDRALRCMAHLLFWRRRLPLLREPARLIRQARQE